jgi:hypothetical protein
MKKLIAPLAVTAALSASAGAADQAIHFVIDRDGRISIDCMGTVPTNFSLIKERLEELKRADPQAPVDFVAIGDAPAALVSKYRELVVSEGFRFGKARSGPCN